MVENWLIDERSKSFDLVSTKVDLANNSLVSRLVGAFSPFYVFY